MESGPHEEAAYLEEKLDEIEETAEAEEDTRQSKRARYIKGESASASSPTKQSNPEMDAQVPHHQA